MAMEKARANAVVQVGWDAARTVMTLHIVGAGKPDIVFNINRAARSMRERLATYGAEVRITRAAALRMDDKTGKPKPASPVEKWERVKRMAEHIASGSEDWNPPSGDRIGADESLLSRVLQALNPSMDVDKIRRDVTSWTAEQRRAMLTNANGKTAKIAEKARELKAADVADVDTEELLGDYIA